MKTSSKKTFKYVFVMFVLLFFISFAFSGHLAAATAWSRGYERHQLPEIDESREALLLHLKQIEEHYQEKEKRLSDLLQSYQQLPIREDNLIQARSMMEATGEQGVTPIYTVDDLINISQNMSAQYILMVDLDLSGVPDWTPLIGAQDEPFSGVLDGNGFSIRNLQSTQGGLIRANNGGIIKNLNLPEVRINYTGKYINEFGAISGVSLGGLITNCRVTGEISSIDSVAGVTSYVYEAIVSHCIVDAIITSGEDAGGITNYNCGGVISNCVTSGMISSTSSNTIQVGGIASASEGDIVECSSSAICSTLNGSTGGIAAAFWEGDMSDCFTTGAISGNTSTGGIAGAFWESSMTNCYATGAVSGGDNSIGGVAGAFWKSSMTDCYATGAVSGGDNSIGGVAGAFSDSEMESCYASGNVSGEEVGGLVGWTRSSIFNNCDAAGSVHGIRRAGGFAESCTNNTVISYCYSTGNVAILNADYYADYIGGFIGLIGDNCLVSNCYSSGNVTCDGSDPNVGIGGFVGQCFGSVRDCTAYGDVQGYINVGGMFGVCGSVDTNPDQEIIKCYSFGNVLNTGNNTGGFAGVNYSTGISQCCALGNVTGQGDHAGGFAGEDHGASTDCYAWGDVTGVDYVGGYLGYGGSRLTNVYSKGRVTATGVNAGGLIGNQDFAEEGGTVTSCYYDMQTSGQSDSGRGTPQTTSAMQQQVTFTGWDFNNIWKIREGASYPYFIETEMQTISKETLGVRSYCFYGRGSVNLSTGNFIMEQTDLFVPSLGLPLDFTRFYNSTDIYTGPMGKGWTHKYNTNLTVSSDGVTVTYADGHTALFTNNGSGYDRPAGCLETLETGPDNTYILTYKDQTKYIFNAGGQLTGITDKNGNSLTLTYMDGLLVTATEPAGRSLSFTYDNNRLNRVTDSAGRSVAYGYDSCGNLATVRDVLGNLIQYNYDRHGLTEIIDPDGVKITRNDYDHNNRVTRQADGNGNETAYSYDQDNCRTTMTDALGNNLTVAYDEKYRVTDVIYPGDITLSFAYDRDNNLTCLTDALRRTSFYSYDDNGNLLIATDPAGNTSTMTYDNSNNLLSVTNPAGKQVAFTYDPNGNLITVTDPLGHNTAYTYDNNGFLLSMTTSDAGPGAGTTCYTYQGGLLKTVTDPAGNVSSFDYDAAGRLVTFTDSGGKTTNMSYDEADNLLNVSDPLGNTTGFTYDWRGNILTKTDPRGGVTSYSYDGNGMLVSRVDALNNETRYEYDAVNQLVKLTDPRGNETTYSYDALGRLTGVTNPLGYTTTNQYDAAGNLTGITDALGRRVLTIGYNLLDKPESIGDALGNTFLSEYDNLGRLTSLTSPARHVTRYDYDDLNRLKTTIDALSGLGRQDFDAHGNLVAMVDPNINRTSYSYDSSDRLTSRTSAASSVIALEYNARNLVALKTNARGQTTTYHYDDTGLLASLINPDGTVSFTYDQNGNLLTATDNTGTIEYQYDALNRVIKYIDNLGNVIQYAYDANGNLNTLTYPGGRQVQYNYDAADRLVEVTDWAGRVTAYEYDPNGRLVRTTYPNGASATYDYNEAGKLIQIKEEDNSGNTISKYNYTYDPSGNIIEEINHNENVPFTMNGAVMTYAADNRLATYNGQTVVYDADGNMTYGPLAGDMSNFTYDARGRLIGAGNTTYTYDAGNNRTGVREGIRQTSYIVNPNASLSQVLIQTGNQSGQTYYVYGLGLIGQESSGGVYHTYHFDLRGSTVALTNEAGQVTDRFQYTPYGELVYRSGNTATPFLFCGRYGVMTDESDLYYMRARYYNPVAKRFLSPDTLTGQVSNPQSQNLYTYCEGKPVNYVDPTGHNEIAGFMEEYNVEYDALFIMQITEGIGNLVAPEPENAWDMTMVQLEASGIGMPPVIAAGTKIAGTSGIVLRKGVNKVYKIPNPLRRTKNLSGEWVKVNEYMSEASRKYQKQITGRDEIWLQNGVRYDGMKNGILIEAKGDYSAFIDERTGKFKVWFTGVEDIIDQAAKQLEASEGAPVVWYFSDKTSMDVIKNYFESQGIIGIIFIYEPLK